MLNLPGHSCHPTGYPWLSYPRGAPHADASTFSCTGRILKVFEPWCGISSPPLALHVSKAYFPRSFRNIPLVNFVYDYRITEKKAKKERIYLFQNVLSAWTHPIRENHQYYLTLLCHTKWFASQLLESIWILERIMVGHCGLTYLNRNVWGCCHFCQKCISLYIWKF